jgi:hypothetical protein
MKNMRGKEILHQGPPKIGKDTKRIKGKICKYLVLRM